MNPSISNKHYLSTDVETIKQRSDNLGKSIADDALTSFHKSQLEDDSVSISSQAKEMFAQEQQSQKPATTNQQSTEDKLLEEFQGKIADLKLELRKLQFDDSEQAKQKARQLQNQINAYNAIVIDLLGKKLDSL